MRSTWRGSPSSTASRWYPIDATTEPTSLVYPPGPTPASVSPTDRGSFTRHTAEAERIGIHVRVVREPRLAWDVDVPADLAEPSWPTP